MVVAPLCVQVAVVMRLEHTHDPVDLRLAAPQLVPHAHAKVRRQIAERVERADPLLQQEFLLLPVIVLVPRFVDGTPECQFCLHIDAKV